MPEIEPDGMDPRLVIASGQSLRLQGPVPHALARTGRAEEPDSQHFHELLQRQSDGPLAKNLPHYVQHGWLAGAPGVHPWSCQSNREHGRVQPGRPLHPKAQAFGVRGEQLWEVSVNLHIV